MSEARGVAIITGGSRGIGRAIALLLARSGWDCAISFLRNTAAADEVKGQIDSLGRRALLVQGDVGNSDDRRRLVEQTLTHFSRLDLLVNNAAVAPAVRTDLLHASEESFDRVISTNLKGPYFLTQQVARVMIERQTPGQIVNIGSVSAYAASSNRGEYCVAKAGVAMMTKLFAARLAEHGINVYEIRPGIIATDMTAAVKEKYDKLILEDDLTPIHRWGTPDDVAKAVLAAASGLLPFSTGEVINVDGGFHLRRL